MLSLSLFGVLLSDQPRVVRTIGDGRPDVHGRIPESLARGLAGCTRRLFVVCGSRFLPDGNHRRKVKEMPGFFADVIRGPSPDCLRLRWVPFDLGLVDCSHVFRDNHGTMRGIFVCPA